MKRVLSLILTLAVVFSVATSLVSCANYETDQNLTVYYIDNLYDFDPATNFTNDDALEVLNLIYEPLFTYDQDGKLVGALVEKYSYDEDTRQLTLTLRTTCWSDEEEITGEDLLFAWKRILSCDFACDAAPLLYDVENAYECKISALDPDTEMPIGVDDLGIFVDVKNSKNVIVTLREGADVDRFLRNLTSIALTPLDEDSVSGVRSEYWATRTATLKTSGPFTVKNLDHNMGYFNIGRNNYYRVPENAEKIDLTKYVLPSLLSTTWVTAAERVLPMQRNPFLNKYEYYHSTYLRDEFTENFLAGLENVYKDTIFFMGTIPLSERLEYAQNGNVVTADSLSTYGYIFNLNNPNNDLVKDSSFRNAISKLISRKALAELLVFAKPASGLVTNGVYNKDTEGSFRTEGDANGALLPNEKVEDAATRALIQQLIDAEVNKIPEADTAARDAKRASLSRLTLVYRDSEEDQAVAEAVKEALAPTVTLNIVPLSYTYITSDIESEEGVSADDVPFVFDALNLAYTRNEEGNLFYYEYNDSKRENPKQYDMIALDIQMLSTDAFAVLASFSSNYNGNGINTSDGSFSYETYTATGGWKNAEYDELIEKAYLAESSADRANFLHDAEELLLSEMPVIPLLFNVNCAIINPQLVGVTVTPHYGYFNMTRAYVKEFSMLPETEEETTGN